MNWKNILKRIEVIVNRIRRLHKLDFGKDFHNRFVSKDIFKAICEMAEHYESLRDSNTTYVREQLLFLGNIYLRVKSFLDFNYIIKKKEYSFIIKIINHREALIKDYRDCFLEGGVENINKLKKIKDEWEVGNIVMPTYFTKKESYKLLYLSEDLGKKLEKKEITNFDARTILGKEIEKFFRKKVKKNMEKILGKKVNI